MIRQHDLADYIQHVERYGPECVLETAPSDLSKREVGQLKAYIDSKERVFRFRRGEWVERKGKAPRACAHCGLDLPSGGSVQMRYHRHCRETARRRRKEARRLPGGGWAARIPPLSEK